MRIPLAAAAALLLTTAPAGAAIVNTRVEGKTQTLFEGPVDTNGNNVKGSSDQVQRTCDGTNNHQNPAPGPTATGAAVDGLRSQGVDFDARWFAQFDDYYITRFGPDAEDLGANEFWGILLDDTFTDVGGCQARAPEGSRVLWAYDAFHDRGFLKLAKAGDTAASPTTTVTAVVAQPLTVVVTRGYGEMNPTFAPFGGAKVAPVTTAANGFQTVETGAPQASTTAVDGTAVVVFGEPGWHRIKADGGTGGPIRSNRLDVCVVANPSETCTAPAPPDVTPRKVDPLPPDPAGPGNANGAVTTGDQKTQDPATAVGAPIIELPRFTSKGLKTGRVGVSWRVLTKGVGVASWSFGRRAAGRKSGRYTTVATGKRGTTALLKLPTGRTWSILATFTDTLGRGVHQAIGDMLVPIDAGAKAVKRRGRWTKVKDGGAWLGAVHRGGTGASFTVKLAAGKPVVLVRGVKRTSDVELLVGGKRAIYRVSGSRTTRTREVVAAKRAKAGSVRVRVLSGAIGVDGVGVRP